MHPHSAVCPVLDRIGLDLLSSSPLAAGRQAPRLSLTADSGTWVRISDHLGQQQVLVVFLKSLDGSSEWLQQLESKREQLTELDTLVVAVHTARTDKLRAFRQGLGLQFPLTYDPFALEARSWKAASRWRPTTRAVAYLVDLEGQIAWSAKGLPSVEDIVEAAAAARGVSLPGSGNADEAADATVTHIDSAEAVAFLEQEDVKYLLLDVRTGSEYYADHAPMAVHIPVDELPQRASELGQTDRVLCICQAGGRSQAAAEFLVSIGGHEIYNVMGGMSAWSGPRITGGEAAES